MMLNAEQIVIIISSIFASTGFWALIQTLIVRRDKHVNCRDRILLGLAHTQIIQDGEEYIKRGYITSEEYESLNEYLYKPYKELGGNGSAERVMQKVGTLPLRKEECSNEQ